MVKWRDRVNRLLGFCTAYGAFGEDTTHRPIDGGEQVLNGIWSDVYTAADPDEGIMVMSNAPNVGFRVIDLTTYPRRNDTIERDDTGTQYNVRAVEPDGEGAVTLVLEKKHEQA